MYSLHREGPNTNIDAVLKKADETTRFSWKYQQLVIVFRTLSTT